MAVLKFCSCFLISISSLVACCFASQPLFLWHNNQNVALEQPPASNTLRTPDFIRSYLKPLKGGSDPNILLFLHQKLSLEDVKKLANVYSSHSNGGYLHSVKDLLESYPSVQLPQVASSANILQHLETNYADRMTRNAAQLSSKNGQLLVVHLPEDVQEAGNLMSELTAKAAKIRPMVAMYTGLNEQTAPDHVALGRHLLAATDAPPAPAPAADNNEALVNITDCLYFYTTNVTVTTFTSGKADVKVLPKITEEVSKGTTCSETEAYLSLQWTTPINVKVQIWYRRSRQFWRVSGGSMSVGSDGARNLTGITDIEAPARMSYHCTRPGYKQRGGVAVLGFNKLQTQVGVVNSKFGPADDCTGFFDIGSLAGLFTAIILLAILTMGLFVIANIKTIDRFDDPKGKTISVNVNE